jgi:recombinational DNA repair protein RecR
MWCPICRYLKHEGCCEGCLGHTVDGQCVIPELLDVSELERLASEAGS